MSITNTAKPSSSGVTNSAKAQFGEKWSTITTTWATETRTWLGTVSFVTNVSKPSSSGVTNVSKP